MTQQLVTSAYRSCRGPEFGSQILHNSLQLPVSLDPGDLTPSTGLHKYLHSHTCIHKDVHIIKNKVNTF